MTLEQLRIFVAVAERQHLTRAAEALNLTQSTVSHALAALEKRHGVRLFDRIGRTIQLNRAGEVFLEQARKVLAQADEASAALDDLSAMKRGRLSIHASQTIANYWLPALLAAYNATYPGVGLEVAIGNTREAAKAVAEGRADLGLIEGAVDDARLSQTPVAEDPLCLVVGRDHPWAQGAPSVADLAAGRWIVREEGSGTRAAFEAAMASRGLDVAALTIGMVLPSNEAVRGAVEAGGGAAVLSRHVARLRIEAGRLVEVPFAGASRAFVLIRHRQRRRTGIADAFEAMLRA